MEWAFGAVIVIMLGLYVYSVGWTGRKLTKKIQPFLDELFGTRNKSRK